MCAPGGAPNRPSGKEDKSSVTPRTSTSPTGTAGNNNHVELSAHSVPDHLLRFFMHLSSFNLQDNLRRRKGLML